jgi:hypothetical protein
MAFDQSTRNRLNRFVADSRGLLATEFTRQLQATYGMNPVTGEVANINSLAGLTPHQQETAQLLRDTFEHYLAANDHSKGKSKEKENRLAALDRIVREQAFTVLNRLAALRMSEARGFLTESLANGYDSKGFQLFHRIAGTSLGETGEAYTHYLFSIFDEFTLDLSVLFDRFAAQGRLFPSTPVLLELLALINNDEVAPLWSEDETIGWIYQYFNSQEERKKMRDASQAPRNSRELAVRNQFFTPRYVVEFLTDNTLGRIWYEMTKGQTKLVDECEYLVKRPNEIFLNQGESAPEQDQAEGLSQEELLKQTVYIEHRALKDPRNIKMLDPACGSMHFGLYCFDLFERIYDEAWEIEAAQGSDVFVRENNQAPLTHSYHDKAEFLTHVPRLIIEHNIHGVDIDPRAAQVAGMSLWQRAHNSWQQAEVKPQLRPQITKSNIVCAEPMPGEKELLQEFASQLKPTVLGQLVEVIFEKMELAGEAGTLLKIEKEIEDAIAGAKSIWQQQNQTLNQFPDLAKVAKQRGDVDFDVSDIDDEGFWNQAEQKILDALASYASSTSSSMTEQKRLFAADAENGFSFIGLCKKRFDIVLMNPPFGEPAENAKAYCKLNYKSQVQDLYCLFVERAIEQKENCLVGAITSGSFLKYNEYSNYREFLIKEDKLDTLLDLGWDVLDGAYVNTAAYFFTSYQNRPILFTDLKDETLNKQTVKFGLEPLGKDISSFQNYYINSNVFKKISGNPFCYSFSGDFFNWVENSNKIKSLTQEHGIGAGPHNFFFRLNWEIPRNQVNEKYNWSPLVNGGSLSPYYRSVNLVLDWRANGEFVKEHLRFKYPYLKGNVGIKIQREGYYFKQGITYGKKTDRFTAQLMPQGCIPSFEGAGMYLKDEADKFWLLAYLNSRFVAFFLNLTSGLHKNPVYIDRLPVPELSDLDKRKLELNTQRIITLTESIHALFETNNNYDRDNIPRSLQEFDSIDDLLRSFYLTEVELMTLLKSSDDIINLSIPISESLTSDMVEDQGALLGESYTAPIKRSMMNLPKVFSGSELLEKIESGYTELDVSEFISNYRATTKKQYWFYNYLLSWAIGGLWGEKGNIFTGSELSNLVLTSLKNDLNCQLVNFEKMNVAFKVENTENYLDKASGFFDFHYKEYSANGRNAPIYWPLQTLSSSFTIWVNYHALSAQTLLGCINDFVEPKIQKLSEEIIYLRNNGSKIQNIDRQIDSLLNFKFELEEFKNELLRLSKYWEPNQNDGVQITAAPLWRLFQHKAWQKKLKQTWGKLQEGEYDWAHLAFSIWPERVLKKCHTNLSIAIAHDVENDLWHEVEVIKKNKKEPVWEWQPKEFSDAELHGYIKEKIATDERLKLYRSNNASNLNGGKL